MLTKVAEAYASAREVASETKEKFQLIRETAPSLSAGLIIASALVGVGVGWFASRPFTRHSVNAEWREKLATKSEDVRAIVKQGNADADATDAAVIKAIGDTDAKRIQAEENLRTFKGYVASDDNRCRVPADCLRIK